MSVSLFVYVAVSVFRVRFRVHIRDRVRCSWRIHVSVRVRIPDRVRVLVHVGIRVLRDSIPGRLSFPVCDHVHDRVP